MKVSLAARPRRDGAESVLRRAVDATCQIELLEERRLMAGDTSTIQSLPFHLDFSTSAGGLTDAAGLGTGFTLAMANKASSEYQAGLLHLDTAGSRLQLKTTGSSAAGGPWESDNSLVDGLQTQFNGATGKFTINTRLIGPLSTFSAPSEQAGLLFGPDDDNYVKLVAVSTPNGQFLQFVDEQKAVGASTFTHAINANNSYTSIGSFSGISTLDLEIAGDASTGRLTAFYSINGGTKKQVSQSVTLSGSVKSAFFSTAARAGIMAMAKNDLAPVTANFDSFAIASGTPVGAPSASAPSVISSTPSSGATGVDPSSYIACDLNLTGAGLNAATLNGSTVYLVQTSTGTKVAAVVNTTGGGDAIILTPSATLKPNTQYTFTASAGVKDTNGTALVPYTATFTTGVSTVVDKSIAFTKASLAGATGIPFTCVRFGPDGKLYASSEDGRIFRYPIKTDGTLGTPLVSNALTTLNGAKRLISGFTFDPSSTRSHVTLWVCNGYYALLNAPDFSSKITVVSGSQLETAQDAVVGLPRAARDHLTEQPVFGPDGALYFCQGSTSAMGAADAVWGNRSEHLLTAAILRLDVSKITPGTPINVKTEAGGTYNPYAADAPLTIYATGVRNAFQLIFTKDGTLFAVNNGSAAGGNTPGFTAGASGQANGNRPDTGKPYAGPNVPSLKNVPISEDDYVFEIVKGGYYGHPNPKRGEFVLNGGNPTSGKDVGEVSTYPVGTKPDPNYRGYAFNLGAHHSPDGVIEYTGGAFGGKLAGKLLVAEYSGGADVAILSRDANGNIASVKRGVPGLTNFGNPINLTEDPATGNLYVAELGAGRLMLLRPSGSKDTNVPGAASLPTAKGTTSGVTVSWNSNIESDVVGYNIYAATSEDGPFTKVNSSPAAGTSFNDATAKTGLTTWYQISAVDAAGNESARSGITSGMRINPNPPAAPDPAAAESIVGGLALAWDASPEADLAGYNVYRSNSPTGSYVKLNDGMVSAASYDDTTAPAGTSYYRITAVNTSNKESVTSATTQAVRDITPPAAPLSFFIKKTKRGVMLIWLAGSEPDVAGYNIYVGRKAFGPWTKVKTTLQTTPTFIDETTKRSRQMWYYVTAVDASGNESAPSEAVSQAHPRKRPRR